MSRYSIPTHDPCADALTADDAVCVGVPYDTTTLSGWRADVCERHPATDRQRCDVAVMRGAQRGVDYPCEECGTTGNTHTLSKQRCLACGYPNQ